MRPWFILVHLLLLSEAVVVFSDASPSCPSMSGYAVLALPFTTLTHLASVVALDLK
jgi:hypothetical protein